MIKKGVLIMEEKEHQVINFIDQIKDKESGLKLIPEIIELHFHHKKNDILFFNGLQSHLFHALKVDPMPLLMYLSDLNFDLSIENKYTKALNKVKSKYGFLINEELQKMKEPFLLNTVETNVEFGSSTHKICFKRADGESFSAVFTTGTIIPILGALTTSTIQAIDRGIYNLNEEDIKTYLRTVDQLSGILIDLLKDENE